MKSILCDVLGLCGVGLVWYGLWQVFPPSAWIAAGLLLVLLAITGAKRWA